MTGDGGRSGGELDCLLRGGGGAESTFEGVHEGGRRGRRRIESGGGSGWVVERSIADRGSGREVGRGFGRVKVDLRRGGGHPAVASC
jgi:hypothetical protein